MESGEPRTVIDMAVEQHRSDTAARCYVSERIGVKQDEVGAFPDRDRTKLAIVPDKARGVDRRGSQHLGRCQSCRRELRQLVMVTQPGDDRVAADQHGDASAMGRERIGLRSPQRLRE